MRNLFDGGGFRFLIGGLTVVFIGLLFAIGVVVSQSPPPPRAVAAFNFTPDPTFTPTPGPNQSHDWAKYPDQGYMTPLPPVTPPPPPPTPKPTPTPQPGPGDTFTLAISREAAQDFSGEYAMIHPDLRALAPVQAYVDLYNNDAKQGFSVVRAEVGQVTTPITWRLNLRCDREGIAFDHTYPGAAAVEATIIGAGPNGTESKRQGVFHAAPSEGGWRVFFFPYSDCVTGGA